MPETKNNIVRKMRATVIPEPILYHVVSFGVCGKPE